MPKHRQLHLLQRVREQHAALSARPDVFATSLVEQKPATEKAVRLIEAKLKVPIPLPIREVWEEAGGFSYTWHVEHAAAWRVGAIEGPQGDCALFSPADAVKAVHRAPGRVPGLIPLFPMTDEACAAVDVGGRYGKKGAVLELAFDSDFDSTPLADSLQAYVSAWAECAFAGVGPVAHDDLEGLAGVERFLRDGYLRSSFPRGRQTEAERAAKIARYDQLNSRKR